MRALEIIHIIPISVIQFGANHYSLCHSEVFAYQWKEFDKIVPIGLHYIVQKCILTTLIFPLSKLDQAFFSYIFHRC